MSEKSALVLRLEPEVRKRLEECAQRIHIKKYTLAILAIEAAVNAIEENGYRLVVPIQFQVAHVPTEKSGTSYPSHRDQIMRVEEVEKKKPSSATDTERKILKALKKDIEQARARGAPPEGPR